MQPDKISTSSTARHVANLNLRTLRGEDNEESNRQVRELLQGVKPFKNDEEFFAYARKQWEARQQREAAE